LRVAQNVYFVQPLRTKVGVYQEAVEAQMAVSDLKQSRAFTFHWCGANSDRFHTESISAVLQTLVVK